MSVPEYFAGAAVAGHPLGIAARVDEQYLPLEEGVAQLGVKLWHDVQGGAAVARADPAGVGEHPVLHQRQLAPRQLVGELWISPLFILIVADYTQNVKIYN